MNHNVNAAVESIEIEAVIVRKSGQIEPLGTVAYWNKNPFARLSHWAKRIFKRS